MRAYVTVALSVGLATAASSWIDLFDGKSVEAWREVTGKPFPSTWIVDNGLLRTLNPPGGLQDVCTIDVFSSFELTLEWKLEADGNSGVKYLVQKRDEWNNANGRQARARGPEFQLAGPLEPDGQSDPKRSLGAFYSFIAPTAKPGPSLPDGFNQLRLSVNGDRVEHWLNGVLVLSYDLSSALAQSALRQHAGAGNAITRTSPVCLQNHGSPAWFRKIRIRRLESTPLR